MTEPPLSPFLSRVEEARPVVVVAPPPVEPLQEPLEALTALPVGDGRKARGRPRSDVVRAVGTSQRGEMVRSAVTAAKGVEAMKEANRLKREAAAAVGQSLTRNVPKRTPLAVKEACLLAFDERIPMLMEIADTAPLMADRIRAIDLLARYGGLATVELTLDRPVAIAIMGLDMAPPLAPMGDGREIGVVEAPLAS